MVKLYFVCMGNYYRSRLAEELARYYGQQYGVDVVADSGGLSPNPRNHGPIAAVTLLYLQQKQVQVVGGDRLPKTCTETDLNAADLVICTDIDEQLQLFRDTFPNFKGQVIGWRAPDWHADPFLSTPQVLDRNVEALIKSYAGGTQI